ncbi:MAG: uroporphyrinogen-III synthase, partial [Actinomycetota bacterium]|nr:uroporphyrinogen-III synthase [Actinomycetota bacterium]
MEGVRVGVTASRRADQLATALRRKGASVVVGPTVGGDRPEPDQQLAASTDAIVAAQPDWLVASTGMGMRLWAEAAERTGRLDELRRLVAAARCVARGPKAVGGLRAVDAEPEWVSPEETDADVVRWLSDHVQAGDAVAVQLHGSPFEHPYGQLSGDVRLITITPYRSVLPDDTGPARRLILTTLDGELDVLTFTSVAAVRGLFAIARDEGLYDRLTAALRGPVAVAVVGPVTAAAFDPHDVPVAIVPSRSRTSELIRAIA